MCAHPPLAVLGGPAVGKRRLSELLSEHQLGIVGGILGISYNGLFLANHDFMVLSAISALFALSFEVIIGGRLLFY